MIGSANKTSRLPRFKPLGQTRHALRSQGPMPDPEDTPGQSRYALWSQDPIPDSDDTLEGFRYTDQQGYKRRCNTSSGRTDAHEDKRPRIQYDVACLISAEVTGQNASSLRLCWQQIRRKRVCLPPGIQWYGRCLRSVLKQNGFPKLKLTVFSFYRSKHTQDARSPPWLVLICVPHKFFKRPYRPRAPLHLGWFNVSQL